MKTIRQNDIKLSSRSNMCYAWKQYTKKYNQYIDKYIVDITTQYIYYQQYIYLRLSYVNVNT